jgi:hypothetical protein
VSKTDPSLNPKLSRAPTYQKALKGQWFAPGMPRTEGYKAMHLRAAARVDGIEIPSGYAFKDGKFQDANQDRWYSDPRVIGPAAVGAATLGAGMLVGPATTMVAPGIPAVSGTGVGVTAPSLAAVSGGAGAGGGVSSWLAPALNYGVPAVTNLIGLKMQGNADRDAAALQSEYLNRALEVEKEKEQYQRGQRADYLGRLKPYQDAGTGAVGRASDLLTTSRYRPEVSGGMGPTVALKDSQGVIRQVPASEAERYIQAGAVRA